MIRESHTLFSVHNLERSYHSQAMFSLFILLATPRNSFNSLIHFFPHYRWRTKALWFGNQSPCKRVSTSQLPKGQILSDRVTRVKPDRRPLVISPKLRVSKDAVTHFNINSTAGCREQPGLRTLTIIRSRG